MPSPDSETATATKPEGHFQEDVARAALEQAHLNAVRISLYYLTRDPDLAKMRVDKQSVWGGNFNAHLLFPEDQQRVKEKALAYFRNRTTNVPPPPGLDETRRLMEIYADTELEDSIARFGLEEVAFSEFPRGVEWKSRPAPDVLSRFHVTVIGAGVGGLAAAIQLKRLGIPFTVIERQLGVGGTWMLNDYLDSRVDLPSQTYSYTFEKNYPWKQTYATQAEVKKYLQHCADKYEVTPHIRLGIEVAGATWKDASSKWDIRLRRQDGNEEHTHSNVIISAAGLFSTPNIPDIPGAESFKGRIFHTTAWDHDYSIAGRRAGLIGNGSTGVQLMPALAAKVAKLTIFQRTPGWMAEVDSYKSDVSPESRWLNDNLPYYWNWSRFALFHSMTEEADGLMTVDPEWQALGGKISPRNDAVREYLLNYIKQKLADCPDLIEKCVPNYAPWARRLIVDSGWFEALKRPNVELVTTCIERITPDGVLTTDGVEHKLDLIVLAAGFKVSKYLWPAKYQGRNGITVEEAWRKDGPRAYYGLTMPDFPNLFMIYGPNSQTLFGGLFMWLEVWTRYAVKGVTYLLENNFSSMEVRRDVFQDYNVRMDKELDRLVSNIPGHGGYYRDEEHGRPGVSSPWQPGELRDHLENINPAHYDMK